MVKERINMKALMIMLVVAIFAVPLTLARDPSTADKTLKTAKGHNGVAGGVIEGYIRDESGKPIKNVFVSIDQGYYATQGHTDVVPIYIPNTVAGAVVFNDPNAVDFHNVNEHHAKTSENGHYILKSVPPGRYTFSAQPLNRDWVWGTTSTNEKLERKYVFSGSDTKDPITVVGGQKVVHDVVLH